MSNKTGTMEIILSLIALPPYGLIEQAYYLFVFISAESNLETHYLLVLD